MDFLRKIVRFKRPTNQIEELRHYFLAFAQFKFEKRNSVIGLKINVHAEQYCVHFTHTGLNYITIMRASTILSRTMTTVHCAQNSTAHTLEIKPVLRAQEKQTILHVAFQDLSIVCVVKGDKHS